MTSEFPPGWKLLSIESCMAAVIDYRGKSPRKVSSGVPLITARIVKGGRILPPDEYIADEDYREWMRRGIPESGDILLTTEAPLGEVAQLDGRKVALAQRLIALRGKPEVLDNRFLKFVMQSHFVQNQLRARATGTTVHGVRQSELRKVQLPVPPMPEQRVIAHILGTLDNKIELNRKMNEALEAMARAIFKSWFVDFDPVRTKAEGRQPFGMNADTAAFFPDSFERSTLGKIPNGWSVAPLSQAFHVNPPRSLVRGHEATYVDMQNMPTQGHRPLGWIRRPFVSGSRFTNGDTLIARITPCLENGKTAYVDFLREGEVGWGSTEFIVFRPNDPLPPEYGYCLARDDEFRNFAIHNMSGSSGRQRVPTDCFREYPIVVPPKSVAQCFGQLIRPLFARVKTNNEESATLAAIRDALLPKLVSGQIRVSSSDVLEVTTS
jgi:type I restriction enzyme, S subunit